MCPREVAANEPGDRQVGVGLPGARRVADAAPHQHAGEPACVALVLALPLLANGGAVVVLALLRHRGRVRALAGARLARQLNHQRPRLGAAIGDRLPVVVLGLDVVGHRRSVGRVLGDLGAVGARTDRIHLAPQKLGGPLRTIGEHDLVELEALVDVGGDADGVPLLDLADSVVGEAAGRRRGRTRRRVVGRGRRSTVVSTRRGGRRRGGALPVLLRLVERLADLGRDQRRGHGDCRLDGQRLGKLLLAELAVLEPFDDHHAHVNVGARRDRVSVEPRAAAELERLLQDLARLLELALVDRRQGLAVQLGHPGGRILRLGHPARRGRRRTLAEQKQRAHSKKKRTPDMRRISVPVAVRRLRARPRQVSGAR